MLGAKGGCSKAIAADRTIRKVAAGPRLSIRVRSRKPRPTPSVSRTDAPSKERRPAMTLLRTSGMQRRLAGRLAPGFQLVRVS